MSVEVLAGVVDHVVGAEGPDEVGLRGAAHAGHVSTERMGQLDGEGADTACRADDQCMLAGLDASDVTQAL